MVTPTAVPAGAPSFSWLAAALTSTGMVGASLTSAGRTETEPLKTSGVPVVLSVIRIPTVIGPAS
jgi:hypothetical protein